MGSEEMRDAHEEIARLKAKWQERRTNLIEYYEQQLTQAHAWRRWRSEKPTVEGLYLYRHDTNDEGTVCQITTPRNWPTTVFFVTGYKKEFSKVHGQWAGPIPEGVE